MNVRFTTPAACLMVTALAVSAWAQSPAAPDPATVALTQKVEALERALAEVKAELAQRAGVSPVATAAPVAAPAAAPPPAAVATATAPAAKTDPSIDPDIAALTAENDVHTLGPLQIRGFTDFTYGRPVFDTLPGGNLSASTNGFSLGDFDLFTTGKLGDHFSVLGELLITSDFTNQFSAEMDRLLLTYSPSDYFQISAGKYNTAIGYYTNEFHRARYFQTATGRPILFTDEDQGGILPVHSIGLTATGKIPSGELGLHWVAEIANGRSSTSVAAVANGNGAEPVQNFADENNGKAVNFAVYARPTWWNGFEVGASMLVDRMYPQLFAPLNQRIYSAHVAYVKSHIELIAESVYLRHEFTTTHQQFNTTSSYAQASYLFAGRYRPYFRYEYQNVPTSDPIFGILGREDGPTGGLRFDWSEFVALKLQYGRLGTGTGPTANDFEAQIAAAF